MDLQANMYVGGFQETKLMVGIYILESAGYRLVTTSVPSRQRGGVALFYKDSPNFMVKVISQFGAIVITCQ